MLAAGQYEVSILGERGQIGSIRHLESEAWKFCVKGCKVAGRGGGIERFREPRQVGFKFRPENCRKSRVTQISLVERSIESTSAKMGRRILCPDCRKPMQSEASGSVHRQIKNQQLSLAQRCFIH